jgi:hypothetical protein
MTCSHPDHRSRLRAADFFSLLAGGAKAIAVSAPQTVNSHSLNAIQVLIRRHLLDDVNQQSIIANITRLWPPAGPGPFFRIL